MANFGRRAKKAFRQKHGRREGKARMEAPATPRQIKYLEKLGVAKWRAEQMNRGRASEEIERLREENRRIRTPSDNAGASDDADDGSPITEKQAAYLEDLGADGNVTAGWTRRRASLEIQRLRRS